MAVIDRRISLWAPVVAYMALIFALSSIAQTPQLPEGGDKGAHAMLYAGLGVVFVRGLAGGLRARVSWGMVAAAALFAAVYGVSDEFHQWFVPPRQVEAADVVADTVGASLAALALRLRSRVIHGI